VWLVFSDKSPLDMSTPACYNLAHMPGDGHYSMMLEENATLLLCQS